MQTRDYWAERKLMRYYMEDQPYTAGIVSAVLDSSPSRVLELGCNVGRNLRAIRDRAPDVELVGIDINAKAIDWGRRTWGLDLRVGDERSLEPDSADVAFTVSVIDHIPEPEAALVALVAAAPRLILVEPWTGTEHLLKDHTWSWDIAARLRELGCAVTSRRFPINADVIGAEYRMFTARRRA